MGTFFDGSDEAEELNTYKGALDRHKQGPCQRTSFFS
jgi:hypothetical protein